MYIAKLPQHVINRLKAWEVVERPASVIKELVENSLDAGATQIEIHIEKAGKQLISVRDNGTGIHPDDVMMTVERYATSKLKDETDLQRMATYGFRGEALASIAEVSQFTLQTRTAGDIAWYELYPMQNSYNVRQIPFAAEHGTRVFIKDLFGQIPVRKKFLKSDQTERKYIIDLVTQYALIHPEKSWRLRRDGKLVYDFGAGDGLYERIGQIYTQDWLEHLREVMVQDGQLQILGYVGDSSLTFAGSSFFNVFVNKRPVQDKVIKKAVMDAYYRQLAPGMMPFAVLFLDIQPDLVDVNVHPRKLEVRFLDPGSIYTRVHDVVTQALWWQKINHAERQPKNWSSASVQYTWAPYHSETYSWAQVGAGSVAGNWAGISRDSVKGREVVNLRQQWNIVPAQQLIQSEMWSMDATGIFTKWYQQTGFELWGEQVTLIGQLRDMYLLLQSSDAMYLVDHHALAERVLFEQMKQEVRDQWYRSEILLQPVSVHYPQTQDIDELIEKLAEMWFDCSILSPWTVVIYAVPHVFMEYKVDISELFRHLRNKEELTFDLLLDEVFATKSCKASIKAGQRLSLPEMQHLLEDGMAFIPGMFVCQHGRPSAVRIPKRDVDKRFDRA